MVDKESAKVKIINSQGIQLNGYYFPNNSKTCILCIPGFGGAFSNPFIQICEDCQTNGFDFLFCHTQGSYTEKELKKFNNDGTYTYVKRGGCFENFDNIIPDIDAWLNFVNNPNYENIILIGASLGCDKIVKYISERCISNLKKLVFICPQDISKRYDKESHDFQIHHM